MSRTDDSGEAPELTGAAKAKQRADEHGMDQRMHSALPDPDGPTPSPHMHNSHGMGKSSGGKGSSGGYGAHSGMEKALSDHADKLHPVKR